MASTEITVEQTIQKLETTTIADAPVDDEIPAESVEETTANGDETAAVEKEVPIAIREKRRLYVGNLPYTSTEESLKELFSAYDIESVSVPLHPFISGRNSGFGFVDLETADLASKALEQENGKLVGDRTVFLQLARLPSEKREPRRGRGSKRGRGGRFQQRRRQNRKTADAQSRTTEEPKDSEETTESKGKNTSKTEKELNGTSQETTELSHADGKTLATDMNRGLSDATNPATKGRPKRRVVAPKKKGPPKDGIPSTTTVFVANLSFACTQEKLKEYFAAYDPEWIHVATRHVPAHVLKKMTERGNKPRSLGYGFVRFANEETQKKAIEEMNGKEFDGRAIAVRIAIDSQIEKAKNEESAEDEVAEVEKAAEPVSESTKVASEKATSTV
ncbi:hypothetical protein V1511DRAFT_288048 [Dipodascopsis uninucleata]